jgi:hypothetical protein
MIALVSYSSHGVAPGHGSAPTMQDELTQCLPAQVHRKAIHKATAKRHSKVAEIEKMQVAASIRRYADVRRRTNDCENRKDAHKMTRHDLACHAGDPLVPMLPLTIPGLVARQNVQAMEKFHFEAGAASPCEMREYHDSKVAECAIVTEELKDIRKARRCMLYYS